MIGKKGGISAVILILILSVTLSACTAVSAALSSSASKTTTGTSSEESSSEITSFDTIKSDISETETILTEEVTTQPETSTEIYEEVEEPVCSVAPTDISVRVTKETKPTTKAQTKKANYSKPSVPAEFDCFEDSAFIGNSRLLAVGNYNLAKNVYAVVGLNVETVYTKTCEGSKVPVIDEIKDKDFRKVFMMFGDNECGWPEGDNFINQYAKVVASVRERCPDAEIYLISVLPISYEKSQQNQYGYNKDSINRTNGYIQTVCQNNNCTYIDAASSITNSEGYLPDEASTDGCHLGKEYTRIWLNEVAEAVKPPETTAAPSRTKYEPSIPDLKEIFG